MPHETTITVRFAELDPYGHVNHAVYVGWFEVGRTEAMAAVGLPIHELTAAGVQFVITGISVSFHAPAVAGDRVVVRSRLAELGRVRGRWEQEIRRGGDVLARAEVRSAVCGPDGRPRRPPPELLAALAPLLG